MKNVYDRNQLLLETHSLLQKALFSKNIKATSLKEKLKYFVKPIPLLEALHQNFIWYGNKSATSLCIIDIDYETMPLEEYTNKVKNILNIDPSWILKTSKGYHVGFILNYPVFNNDLIKSEKLIDLKRLLTILLGADADGSIRKYGYWRNPLTHPSYLNPLEFDLNDLHRHIHQIYCKNKSQIKTSNKSLKSSNILHQNETSLSWDTINKEGFVKGNRNNWLFHTIIKMLYEGKIKNETVLDTLVKLNDNDLPFNEVKTIARSILKYKITPNINNNKNRIIKRGEFSDILYKNHIHNYKSNSKTVYERQSFGQKASCAKKVINTVQLIHDAYVKAYTNYKPKTNKIISSYSNRSVRSIQRYKHIKKQIAASAFLKYIKNTINVDKINKISHHHMFRANVTPIKEIINLMTIEVSQGV